MKSLDAMTHEELAALKKETRERYDEFAARGLAIDMSRGKPCSQQLDLSSSVLNNLDTYKSEKGVDCRNYGPNVFGIDECRELFADILKIDAKNIIACGNSSLNLMFDYISQCYSHGAGEVPWCSLDKIKYIAVVPGYDRHFGIGEYFGFDMINVPINADGPDMDMIEELIKDEAVKGMFCVPKYSNPDGISYSDAVVERLAKMKPAAKDFRVIWDNAYCVHDLDEGDILLNIYDEAKKYGNEDNFIIFTSTSKITFPGAGVSCIAASDKNIAAIAKRMGMQTIGYDKLNQLRHTKAFKSAADVKAHMKLHADILRPKFQCVLDILQAELGGLGIASWNKPRGGYFISLNVDKGSAKKAGELCKAAGLTLTNVGATFPYGKDENDRNIRIAPTFPPIEELKLAAELLCIAVKLAYFETWC